MIAFTRGFSLDLPPPPAHLEEAALNRARLEGDFAAREQLILGHLRLVFFLARRYAWSTIAAEDLVSAGTEGLVRAVDCFDHSRGRLSVHAAIYIRKALLEHIAAHRTVMRLPSSANRAAHLLARTESTLAVRLGRAPTEAELAAETGLSARLIARLRAALGTIVSLDVGSDSAEIDRERPLHETLADEEAVAAPEEAERASRTECLNRAMARLSLRERVVVERHFGLDGHGGISLAALAPEFGLSAERVRQILAGALNKLRAALRVPMAQEANAADLAPSHDALMDLLRSRLGLAA